MTLTAVVAVDAPHRCIDCGTPFDGRPHKPWCDGERNYMLIDRRCACRVCRSGTRLIQSDARPPR